MANHLKALLLECVITTTKKKDFQRGENGEKVLQIYFNCDYSEIGSLEALNMV